MIKHKPNHNCVCDDCALFNAGVAAERKRCADWVRRQIEHRWGSGELAMNTILHLISRGEQPPRPDPNRLRVVTKEEGEKMIEQGERFLSQFESPKSKKNTHKKEVGNEAKGEKEN